MKLLPSNFASLKVLIAILVLLAIIYGINSEHASHDEKKLNSP